MSHTSRNRMQAIGLLIVMSLCSANVVEAQAPASLAKQAVNVPIVTPANRSLHEGSIHRYGDLQFEIKLEESGIEVQITEAPSEKFRITNARGIATLAIGQEAKKFRFDLMPTGPRTLRANTNLSRIQGEQVEVEILLTGLDSKASGQSKIQFKDIVTLPPTSEQLAASAIARQKLCPVSGKPLGSMGRPIPVSLGKKTVFVCCAGCVPEVKNTSSQGITGRPSVRITTVTEEDAPAIAEQKICPVMDEPLGSMGAPIKVLVGVRPMYLCCRGCVKKIQQDPAMYLALVYGEDTAIQAGIPVTMTEMHEQVRPGVYEVTPADQHFVAAQERCPVMDEPLDAMGGPYKVDAAGRAIYICCPGCANKITTQPEKYLEILQAKGVNVPVIR